MLYIGFDFDFTVQTYTYEHYSMVDVVSKIGGISATIKVLLTFMAPFFAFKFMFIFANIL